MKDTISGIWYRSNNFGDALNAYFFEEISGKRPIHALGSWLGVIKCWLGIGRSYVAIGSLMHYTKRNSVVWGSGCIEEEEIGQKPKEVCAVRGPLTRDELIKKGIPCPQIYGDPALLLPAFYTPTSEKRFKLGIVPHYLDYQSDILDLFKNISTTKIIDITRPWREVVDDITSCENIVSSSLHGLIVADAYGIPSRWVEFSSKVIGKGFKFRDYYASINLDTERPYVMTKTANSEGLISKCVYHKITCDLEALWEACPFQKDISLPPFLEPDYLLDTGSSSLGKRDVSIIIPTFNRAPFSVSSKDFKYNPLFLAIESLRLQSVQIKEIVIIDDGSNDYTMEVIECLKKEGMNVVYTRNEKKSGSCISRNIGARVASGKYLLFFDDDCVLAPSAVEVLYLTLARMQLSDQNATAVVMPVYVRRTAPTIVTLLRGYSHRLFEDSINPRFDGFPIEYIRKPIFLDVKKKILMPVRTYQTWGCFLIDRARYLKVGGFPEFFDWPGKTGEEPELAERLIEHGYSLYFTPDPKAQAYHGRFGSKKGSFRGNDWLAKKTDMSLEKFSEICNSYSGSSGNRISVEDSVYAAICSRVVLIQKRNKEYLGEILNKIKIHFVENGLRILVVKGNLVYMEDKVMFDRDARENLYNNAIAHGRRLLETHTNLRI